MNVISFAEPIENLQNAREKLKNSIEMLESALKQYKFQVDEALGADFLKNYAQNVEIHQHELNDKTKLLMDKIEQTTETLSKMINYLEALETVAQTGQSLITLGLLKGKK